LTARARTARPTNGKPPAKELDDLRHFAGPPREFWPRFLAGVGALTSASKAVLLIPDPTESSRWKRIADWSAHSGSSRAFTAFADQLDALAGRCARNGSLLAPLEPSPARAAGQLHPGRAPQVAPL
jgi:hypothetical protein